LWLAEATPDIAMNGNASEIVSKRFPIILNSLSRVWAPLVRCALYEFGVTILRIPVHANVKKSAVRGGGGAVFKRQLH